MLQLKWFVAEIAHHPTAKVVCITTYVLVSHAEPWKPQFCGSEPWDWEKKRRVDEEPWPSHQWYLSGLGDF